MVLLVMGESIRLANKFEIRKAVLIYGIETMKIGISKHDNLFVFANINNGCVVLVFGGTNGPPRPAPVVHVVV
jgi:hypothetical protein